MRRFLLLVAFVIVAITSTQAQNYGFKVTSFNDAITTETDTTVRKHDVYLVDDLTQDGKLYFIYSIRTYINDTVLTDVKNNIPMEVPIMAKMGEETVLEVIQSTFSKEDSTKYSDLSSRIFMLNLNAQRNNKGK